MRDIKKEMGADLLRRLSIPIVNSLLRHPAVEASQVILAYHSLPDELYTHDFIDQLRERGKTVVLPRVTGPSTMELRLYDGPETLREGSFHIMEPVGERFTDYAKIELALVPGMAFDDAGHRLGRGRGYYDRLLPLLPHAHKIGLCLPFQHVDHVETQAHDITMDEVYFQGSVTL